MRRSLFQGGDSFLKTNAVKKLSHGEALRNVKKYDSHYSCWSDGYASMDMKQIEKRKKKTTRV